VEGQASTYRYKRHSMHQQLPVIVAVVRGLPRELRAREGESASSTQKRARRRRSAATEARGCREQDDERTVILLPDFCAPPLWPFSIASTCGRGTGGPVSCRTRTRNRTREREEGTHLVEHVDELVLRDAAAQLAALGHAHEELLDGARAVRLDERYPRHCVRRVGVSSFYSN